MLLRAGEWEAEIQPRLGGSLALLQLRGIDVLRPFPGETTNPLDTSCFPLVPFCNRIAQARFAFGGQTVIMRPNHAPEPHRLHGISWHRPWAIEEESAQRQRIAHQHDGRGEWPWPYRAEQTVELDEEGCTITLTLANLADSAMPAGLGLHPYFRRRPDTRVTFYADKQVLVGADMIPTGAMQDADALARWSEGTPLPAETIDHCFTNWSGPVLIEDELGSIRLTATGAAHLHVYAPEDGSALCFEPVNHLPDALNQAPDTMPVLAPGKSASLSMRIEATLA